jgi:hypothetical protein
MTPLNQPERRTRLWQFALLYLLALLVPLGASYYLFSNNSLADENARLKKELDYTHQEQAQLVARFDTLSHQLLHIDVVDQRLRDETNSVVVGRLNTQNQDYLNDVATSLSQLRADSARLQVPSHRQLVRDELRNFDLFRANRSSIDALRQQVTRGGQATQENARLAEELGRAQQRIILLEAMARQPAPVAASSGGGGGATVAPPSAGAKQQIALLQDQVAFANADCLRQRALDGKSRKERKQLLEQARTAFIKILQDPATDDLKQSIEKTLEPINVELGRPPRFFGLIN